MMEIIREIKCPIHGTEMKAVTISDFDTTVQYTCEEGCEFTAKPEGFNFLGADENGIGVEVIL